MRILITLSFAIFVALMITGYSRNGIPVEKVRGTVTLDGASAAEVAVTFVPKSDASRPADVQEIASTGVFETEVGCLLARAALAYPKTYG
jgi:hypothetical protein